MLTVRDELGIDVLALELHELEVTEPREDFALGGLIVQTEIDAGAGCGQRPSSSRATSANASRCVLPT